MFYYFHSWIINIGLFRLGKNKPRTKKTQFKQTHIHTYDPSSVLTWHITQLLYRTNIMFSSPTINVNKENRVWYFVGNASE